MKHLRDAKLALLTGTESQAKEIFDSATKGMRKAEAKGYGGLDAEIYYSMEGEESKWIFYLDEFLSFLCHPDYWEEMEGLVSESTESKLPSWDAMEQTSEITKLLFESRFGKPAQDAMKPQKAEFYETIQIHTYLSRHI